MVEIFSNGRIVPTAGSKPPKVLKKQPPAQNKTFPFSVALQFAMSAEALPEPGNYYCSLSLKASDQEEWHECAQTETIDNDVSPSWLTEFDLDFAFHKPIQMRF
jgi:hypothetical protein